MVELDKDTEQKILSLTNEIREESDKMDEEIELYFRRRASNIKKFTKEIDNILFELNEDLKDSDCE